MQSEIITKLLVFLLAGFFLLYPSAAQNGGPTSPPLSKESSSCIDCHRTVTPVIVADWQTSRHATTTPAQAAKKSKLQRRISNEAASEKLQHIVVGCYECHGQDTEKHADSFDHFGIRIHPVVTPNDCNACHPIEVTQFAPSKKAHAVGNLTKNPVYDALVETTLRMMDVRNGQLSPLKASNSARANACFACHGTEVKVKGKKTVASAIGDIEVPDLDGWPNQGIGRVNPDSSRGSCAACHARHAFSIEVARQSHTCSQCHLEPDLPAWEVYRESKHGNIFHSKEGAWKWDGVPWVAGRDFTAPTCATCHNALIISPEGDVVAERTHDFGARLWVRIFGLPYSHPQPKQGDTSLIRNQDGLLLPTTFDGKAASDFLIDQREQEQRQAVMKNVCQSCHSSSWADGHFTRLNETNKETDLMVKAATQLMLPAWEAALEDKTNPFDEPIEMMWVQQWLFYANSVRYAAAMSGPDYASFKNGWWQLNKTLQEMHKAIQLKQLLKKLEK